MRKREEYIDIFKGILIILTVIGHNPLCPTNLIILIYSFHMVAFFAAYGGVYDLTSHYDRLISWGDLGEFILKRAKRLIIPYFIWALIYNNVNCENLLLIIYGSSEALTKAGGLSSLWFFTCMFCSTIMFETFVFFLKKIHRTEKTVAMIVYALLMMGIGFLLPEFVLGERLVGWTIGYPWGVKSAFMACGFIVMGMIIRRIINKVRQSDFRVWFYFLTICCSFILLIVTYKTNSSIITRTHHHVALSRASYGHPLLFLLDAICGIVGLLSLSLLIEECFARRFIWIKKALCTLGVNTMGIFLFHKRILILLSKIITDNNGSGVGWMFVTVAVAILSSYVLTEIIRKVLPEIIGE